MMKKKRMRKRIIKIAVVVFLLLLIPLTVRELWLRFGVQPETIRDLAYDVNFRQGYTVYIQEGEDYHPYLVITENYNNSGKVLLLRKYLMDEARYFDEWRGGYELGYYEDSEMDCYLNEEYADSLAPEVRKAMEEVEITITTPYNLWSGNGEEGIDTMEIKRQVFLLAYTEISIKKSRLVNNEGELLPYFDVEILNEKRRLASREYTEYTDNYWTRSTYRSGGAAGMIAVVSSQGAVGKASIMHVLNVRPAFCVNPDTKLIESTDAVSGKTVYLLAPLEDQ